MKKLNFRKIKNKLLLLFVFLLAFTFLQTGADINIQADTPYKTYTIDGYGYVTETQTAYLPYETIIKIGDESLNAPTDFTVLSDGSYYVLDSGNKRIIASDANNNLIKTFGEGILQNPKGMYVAEDKTCYVADRDARSIFVFDEAGNLTATYGRPTEAMYGETQDFLPLKIVANQYGTMYVICESNTNGMVQISPVEGGTFLGYFGTNSTTAGLWNIIWRAVLTDAQRAKMVGNIPSTPDNMAIDDKGIIYTVTRGEGKESLKRLNIAGVNMISPDKTDDVPVAVATGNHDNVFVASKQGYIYEYNNEGDLLFVFGGSDDGQQRIGLSTKIEAIQVGNDDKIYVLDSDKAQIQVYVPTEFTNQLHDALYLFSKGRYEESMEPLSEVLKMNNLFDYANMAMGRALYKEGEYKQSLEYAELAKDLDGYSDSFWEVRNSWLKKHLGSVIVIIFILIVAFYVILIVDANTGLLNGLRRLGSRLGAKKLIHELSYLFYYIKHPINACYEVKFHNRVSVASANILVAIFTVFFIINKYFCGFLVKQVREGSYDILSDIGTIILVLLIVVGCNYLMCTINEGEGKLRAIYCGFIYSAGPYLVLMPIIFALSHVVTYNEIFFVQFGYFLMGCWIVALEFITVKELNDYSVKDTIKIILLTAFTILIVLLLAFIIYVLWSQVFDFISSLIGEVVYRIGN